MKLIYHFYLDECFQIITPFANSFFINQGDKQFLIFLWSFVESFIIRKFKETTKQLEIISTIMLSGDKKSDWPLFSIY